MQLRKVQLAKLLESGEFLSKTLGNMMSTFDKKLLLDFAVPLVKDILDKLITKATSSVLQKREKKINGRGATRAGRRFNLLN